MSVVDVNATETKEVSTPATPSGAEQTSTSVQTASEKYAGFKFTFEFDINQVLLIYQALGKAPMEFAESAIILLRNQITPQIEKIDAEKAKEQSAKDGAEGSPVVAD